MTFDHPVVLTLLVPWLAFAVWRLLGGGRRRVAVGNLALWRHVVAEAAATRAASRPRLRLEPLLEALVGVAIILAGAAPVLERSGEIADLRVVLDAGAAMRTESRRAAAEKAIDELARARGIERGDVAVHETGARAFSTAGRDFGRDVAALPPAEVTVVIADDLSGVRTLPHGALALRIDAPLENAGIVAADEIRDASGARSLRVAIATTPDYDEPLTVTVRDASGAVVASGMAHAIAVGEVSGDRDSAGDASTDARSGGRADLVLALAADAPRSLAVELAPGGEVAEDDRVAIAAAPSLIHVSDAAVPWRDAVIALGYAPLPDPSAAELRIGAPGDVGGDAAIVLWRGRPGGPFAAPRTVGGDVGFPVAGLDVPLPAKLRETDVAMPAAPPLQALMTIGGTPAIWRSGAREIAVALDVEAAGLADDVAFVPLVAALLRALGIEETPVEASVVRAEHEIVGWWAPLPDDVTRYDAPDADAVTTPLRPWLAALAAAALLGLALVRRRRAGAKPRAARTMAAPSSAASPRPSPTR